ncbi:MBL fold metallo-hydrolase [Chryseobacterium jejuense]|uniref:L-ascorbate metabolism protein UlaG, beta-lactamase superfamily n=1 Tax=Chryseobacterium jejuense TaxID=445960 RepID=A0A2X2VF55_CHRJE|nr:MBL fold metallo-hydrolase [Chryseobacterium jejuense]SDI82320.1 L-ascorbate metabolism protein UlaG, beta-lactamase superfamily [Chryseobacterium jejuense]SQB27716.1 metal-dependent hydrolase [Chryseobacterium jejuense]
MMYWILAVVILLTATYFIVINGAAFGAVPKGKRLDRIRQSKLYRNKQFQNISHTPSLAEGYKMWKVTYDFFLGKKHPLLKPLKKIPSIHTDLKSLDKNTDVFIWLGHSSYYLQTDGVSFLIDPVLSLYGSPFKYFNKAFKGSDIFKPEDIPNLDYLVITHDHFDHLDYPTVKSIKSRTGMAIVPLGVGAHLERWGYTEKQLIEEEWGTEVELKNNIKLTFTPARHFSGRRLKQNDTLWTSYVLETPTKKIFLGGDSGYDSHFKMIGEKYGPFDYAILENGQYGEAWRYIHTLPEDTIQAAIDIDARHIIPVHAAKFALALHPWNEPLQKITSLGKEKRLDILTPKIGEVLDLNFDNQMFTAWWEG